MYGAIPEGTSENKSPTIVIERAPGKKSKILKQISGEISRRIFESLLKHFFKKCFFGGSFEEFLEKPIVKILGDFFLFLGENSDTTDTIYEAINSRTSIVILGKISKRFP